MGREGASQAQGDQRQPEGDAGLILSRQESQQGREHQQCKRTRRHPSAEADRFQGGNSGQRQRGRTAENHISQGQGLRKHGSGFRAELGMHVQGNRRHQQRGQGSCREQEYGPFSFHSR